MQYSEIKGKKFMLIMKNGDSIWRTPSGENFRAKVVKLTKEVWEIELLEHLSETPSLEKKRASKIHSRKTGKKVPIPTTLIDRLKSVENLSEVARASGFSSSYIYALRNKPQKGKTIGSLSLKRLSDALNEIGS